MKFFLIIAFLAALAAFGYYAYQEKLLAPILNQKPKVDLTLVRPVTSKPASLTLDLSNPGENLLVFTSDLLIQGKTLPEATVILSLNDHDQVLNVSAQGHFSQTIKLQEGLNELTVAAFDNQGNGKNEARTIYYSTEKL